MVNVDERINVFRKVDFEEDEDAMIYKNVELFNVEECQEWDKGAMLCRFPCDATKDTKDRASWMAYAAMGCEVRFVCEAEGFWITLGAVAQNVDVYVMRGDYTVGKFTIPAAGRKTIQYEVKKLFQGYDKTLMEQFDERFHHDVWRFYFHSEGACVFFGCNALNGIVRPPKPCEVPKKTMLAYGSSITHWCWAMDSRNSYIQQVARRLNMDVLNKGMAGACRMEDSIMEYLLSMRNWDVAFLELGANVVYSYSVEEFRSRVEFLVSQICKNCPDKKVFLTGFYYGLADRLDAVEKVSEFTKILSEIKSRYMLSNLIYLDGKSIMDSGSYLSYDLCHPSDYGHIRMGENLTKVIKNMYAID